MANSHVEIRNRSSKESESGISNFFFKTTTTTYRNLRQTGGPMHQRYIRSVERLKATYVIPVTPQGGGGSKSSIRLNFFSKVADAVHRWGKKKLSSQ